MTYCLKDPTAFLLLEWDTVSIHNEVRRKERRDPLLASDNIQTSEK